MDASTASYVSSCRGASPPASKYSHIEYRGVGVTCNSPGSNMLVRVYLCACGGDVCVCVKVRVCVSVCISICGCVGVWVGYSISIVKQ